MSMVIARHPTSHIQQHTHGSSCEKYLPFCIRPNQSSAKVLHFCIMISCLGYRNDNMNKDTSNSNSNNTTKAEFERLTGTLGNTRDLGLLLTLVMLSFIVRK